MSIIINEEWEAQQEFIRLEPLETELEDNDDK